MFESVAAPLRARSRAGTAVSLALHAAAIATAALLTARAQKVIEIAPAPPVVHLYPSAAGRGPERPAAAAPERPPHGIRERFTHHAEQPFAAPPPAAPPPAAAGPTEGLGPPDRPPLGSGEGPGNPVGRAGEGPAGPLGSGDPEPAGPLAWQPTLMSPPQRLSGPDPAYTEQALEHEVEGVLEARCVVTTAGEVRGCRVWKSLPFMDAAVIDALERRRYAPARLSSGQAVEVEYTFRVRLRLP